MPAEYGNLALSEPIPVENSEDMTKLAVMIAMESSDYVNSLWNDHQLSTSAIRAKWLAYYKQYRGIPSRRNYEGLANVVVNETLSAVESIVAQMFQTLNSEPRPLMVVGREETDENQAKRLENMMLAYLDYMDWKSIQEAGLRYNTKYGTVVGFVNWAIEEKEVTIRDPQLGPVQEMRMVKNRPEVEIVDLMDVALDPGKADIDKMDWVIRRKRVTWDYIMNRVKNGLYSESQVKRIDRGASKGSEALNNKKQKLQSVGINYCYYDDKEYEILEFWGKVPKWWVDDSIDVNSPEAEDLVQAVCEVCLGGPTLRLERNPFWHQEIPFAIDQFIQVDDEAYGMGVCELVESLQQELNDKRNQLLDHTTEQIAPPLIRNRTANIDKKQIKLRPFQIIDSDIAGDSALVPLKLGGNPLENVTMDSTIKQDIRNESGAPNVVQGVGASKEQTAYELNALLSTGSARINMMTIGFGQKFIKRIYKLIYKKAYQYVNTEEAIRIIGKDGVRWERMTPEDIIYDVDVIPKIPTDFDNRTVIRNQLIQFVGQIAPYYPRVNIYQLVKKIYSLFGFEDVETIVPEPDTERGQNALTVDEEIQVLILGQKIDVKYYEDHLTKIDGLLAFLRQFESQIDQKAIDAIKDKIGQHLKYLQVLESMASTMSASPGPVGGGVGTPKNQKTETAVDSMSQTQSSISRFQ